MLFIFSLNVFFGDYNNISVYDGWVCLIWICVDGVNFSVWIVLVDMERKK